MSEQDQTVKNVSAEGADEGKFGQAGLLNTTRSPSGPTQSQLRGSRASISAPTKERVFNPYASNPARIPTAGGVAVGSKQFEQRRASRVSSDMGVGSKSPPQSPPPISEDAAESSKDGAVNGAASGGTPAFNIPSYEDKDSVAPDAPAPAPATEASATQATPGAQNESVVIGDTTEDKSTTEKVKETVKDKLPGTTSGSTGGTSNTLGSPTSPGSPSKERRGSRFDAFKDKLGISSSKK